MGRPVRPRSALYPHQVTAAEKITSTGQVGAFLSVGEGKTASALTALLDLRVEHTLVVAPALVVEADVWGREARAWDHLRSRVVVPIEGGPAQRKIILDSSGADIEVVSYNLFTWLCDHVDLEERYGAIVFDELSRMKSPGATWFKRMRTRTPKIPIRIGLTGNPKGNHLADLWGEMFAVAGEKPLGPSKVQFMMQYFTAYPVAEHVAVYTPIFGAADIIHEKIKPWAFTMDRGSATGIPPVRMNPIHVELPTAIRDLSEQLASELRVKLASGTDLIALSSSSRAAKVRQLAGGAVYTDDLAERWEPVHEAKLDALQEIVEEQQGEPLLIFYWYRHELERILKRFPNARTVSKESLEAWDRGEVEQLVAHPASAGYGLNLQHGGFNTVWFTLPWSWEMFSQGNGRQARPGQKHPWVNAHILLAGETDRAVLQVLKEKEEAEKMLLKAVTLR
jgi:superfamily II DNA or RNA helicase